MPVNVDSYMKFGQRNDQKRGAAIGKGSSLVPDFSILIFESNWPKELALVLLE